MKWFQKTGNGKWIETDGPFSIFGESGGCLPVIVCVILFAIILYNPMGFVDFLLNLFVYWPMQILNNSTVSDFLTNLPHPHWMDNIGE
jgi:hypothetical protein